MSTNREDRARGCLLGQLVGDALGTTLEFKRAAEIAREYPLGLRAVIGGGPFSMLPGQVTDDSELALALARSLAAHGPQLDEIARAYVRWCRSDPPDIGRATMAALDLPEDSVVNAAAVRRSAATYNGHPRQQANGSLMRCSPLGILGASWTPQALSALAREDSRLTHPTLPCVESCVAYTRAIAVAIEEGADAEACYAAALAAVDTSSGHESGVHQWLVEAPEQAPVCDQNGIGWVKIALQNAFYQLLNAPNFEEALVQTVMAGGDTDTNGCIAAALRGAVDGLYAIPERWRRVVLGCETSRGPVYQNGDAMELALAVLKVGDSQRR